MQYASDKGQLPSPCSVAQQQLTEARSKKAKYNWAGHCQQQGSGPLAALPTDLPLALIVHHTGCLCQGVGHGRVQAAFLYHLGPIACQ